MIELSALAVKRSLRFFFPTIFQITSQGQKTVMYSFQGGFDGGSPYAITQGTDGNFYGITSGSLSLNSQGTIFKMIEDFVINYSSDGSNSKSY